MRTVMVGVTVAGSQPRPAHDSVNSPLETVIPPTNNRLLMVTVYNSRDISYHDILYEPFTCRCPRKQVLWIYTDDLVLFLLLGQREGKIF